VSSLFAKDRRGEGGESLRILAFGELGHGFRGAANMDLVSSFLFRQVYENGLNTISSPLQQSVAFASRNRPDASINFLYNSTGVFLSDQPTDQPTVVFAHVSAVEASIPERMLNRFPLYFDADGSVSGISGVIHRLRRHRL